MTNIIGVHSYVDARIGALIKMNKKEIKKVKKHFMAFLAIFFILFILLGIQILFINLNSAYYGKWFQKYYSFLKDNSVYPKQKSFF